jgi:DNA-binding NarL/FixJ family response regulator
MMITQDGRVWRGKRIGKMENWRILLAESHPDLRQSMVKTLVEMPGLNLVAKVANGWDVMFASSQLKPDVILLDFGLPGLSGTEVAQLIRRGLPEIYVVMLLGDGENDDFHITASEQCGACACLLKGRLDRDLPALLARLGAPNGGDS